MGRRIANPDVTIALIPRHLPTPCPRIPLLSASPQGFCAPPRNVISPPPPVAPLFLAIVLPSFTRAQSTSPGLMTKKRVKEEKEHSKILPFSFTSLALCLASIFALTKRNRLCQRVAATTGV
ncbi:hypothetical protein ALC57_17561 [Trachymyrmex cornetzi]|uniref:Uncharacterized protein n=1 Tax=Trachymyrmex cornetzi TaxID=471704 RepID=A0A195DD60_9HYME|nr:hypothetical protein ALC57_17561 [Trachymyrmex cornetzi]